MLITEELTLSETVLKVKQEVVVAVEIMTLPVAKLLLAALAIAPTFVAVYFL
ncbi:hypothetical protein [Pseudalkalibacillus hwajinpoensis]|uniref:hypothetical protein n=1 Tax=Guptibacillus hwajinpoensis TaxID=208199 RepID=UPI001CD60C38|nr:hypothetical protein [Pseudalkalibacillus hwajinpoensis]MCA0990665.1 hypothetical protein [Pseudalkalibacillus hwajinpoensis]